MTYDMPSTDAAELETGKLSIGLVNIHSKSFAYMHMMSYMRNIKYIFVGRSITRDVFQSTA